MRLLEKQNTYQALSTKVLQKYSRIGGPLICFSAFYNAAFALIALFCQYSSNRRRLASGYHSRPFITKQPNHPVYTFVHDFDQAMILGMHWLLFRNTPTIYLAKPFRWALGVAPKTNE